MIANVSYLSAGIDAARRSRNADICAQILPCHQLVCVGAVEATEEGGLALHPALASAFRAPVAPCCETVEVRSDVGGVVVCEFGELGEPS